MIINFLRVISSTAEVKEANGIITKKTMEFCIGRFWGRNIRNEINDMHDHNLFSLTFREIKRPRHLVRVG